MQASESHLGEREEGEHQATTMDEEWKPNVIFTSEGETDTICTEIRLTD